jgi:uncharacterized membrane protein YkvA (DUF1232 family)
MENETQTRSRSRYESAMGMDEVRELIARAVKDEGDSGRLAKHLAAVSKANLGREPDPKDVAQMVAFVRGYIEALPTMIEQAAAVSAMAGLAYVVQPLLQAATQYFLEPNDLIPDSNGLAGLADDAYLALGLISAVSERHARQTGRQIFEGNFSQPHNDMRALLGPQIAAQLDAMTLAAAQTMYPQMAPALNNAKPLKVPDDPYRGLSLDQRVEAAKLGYIF